MLLAFWFPVTGEMNIFSLAAIMFADRFILFNLRFLELSGGYLADVLIIMVTLENFQ